jgi:hypothetical protein
MVSAKPIVSMKSIQTFIHFLLRTHADTDPPRIAAWKEKEKAKPDSLSDIDWSGVKRQEKWSMSVPQLSLFFVP